jgi:acyl carrier protein
MSDTAERTVRIIADYLETDPAEIPRTASFAEDFEMDSLAKMELIIAFEEAFAIEVTDDGLEMITTVQDAIDMIETMRAETAASTR